MYNFTALENNTNILELFEVVNANTGEMLVSLILITVFVIAFISMKNYETLTAFRSSLFIVSILAVLFFVLGLLSMQYMLMPVILTGLIMIYSVITMFR